MVRAAVVQPLIQRCRFPNRVEMQADRVRRRHNCASDDVVAVHQGTGHWLADAVDVHRGSRDESDDEANGGGQQGGNHQNAEPAHIQAVVGAGNPVTKPIPKVAALATLKGSSHSG